MLGFRMAKGAESKVRWDYVNKQLFFNAILAVILLFYPLGKCFCLLLIADK